MSIITISRGSYSWGKEVAERVASKLGYECIARDVLLEASEEFNIPEIQLLHAIQDAPSFLEHFTHRKERYIAYIQSALLKHFQKDNVVYHGMAGHFFVKHIPHVLKVRIIADFEDRVKLVMERDGISRHKAVRFIKKVDSQRHGWSKHLYGIDTWDPSLYDLVVHIKKITVVSAVDLICYTVGLERFRTTPESQRAIDELALSAEVKAALVDVKPDIDVVVENGTVLVKAQAQRWQEKKLAEEIKRAAEAVPGVAEIEIQMHHSTEKRT